VRKPWSLAEPIAVDEASFTAIVRQARLPIVMAFCDTRSGPCRRIAPDLFELARELAGRAVFLRVDADQLRNSAMSLASGRFRIC
jgi:thioredoxin-like negative regulator of GroEL